DFLTVLAGSDYRSRAGRMTPGEADVLVQLLTANREWAKLWALAFELPLRSSLRVVRELTRRGWRPERDDERAVLGRLAVLAADTLLACERGLAGGQPLPLHGWRDGRRLILKPSATITALEALAGEQMLLADREGQVALFDAAAWRVVASKQFPFWC